MDREPTDAEVPEKMVEAHPEHPARRHDRWLLLIGGFKLVEAVFFLLVGVGAIHFLHRDLRDAVLQLATKLRRDPEGRLVGFVLNHIDSVTAHRLRQIGVATFLYAALRVAEGWGLVLEKAWAEYLTVGVTISFLPLELYEIVRRPDWFRVGILLVNLLVLAYLIWLLQRKREKLAS
jgi:uncharacterized membrane protein (DUF2068 family)